MKHSHQWSYERLFEILDIVSRPADQKTGHESGEKLDLDGQLRSMIQASVPPLMLHSLRFHAEDSNTEPEKENDFDHFTQPIREQVLSTAAMFSQLKRDWFHDREACKIPVAQAPPSWFKAENQSAEKQSAIAAEPRDRQWYRREYQAKRLRWHIQAWGLGILTYPEMRPVCRCASWDNISRQNWGNKYAWDLPELRLIAWDGLGTRLGNEIAAVEIIKGLGPRGRGGKPMVKEVSIEYRDLKYSFNDSLAATSFRLGKDDTGSRLGGGHLFGGGHLLGRAFTSEDSHAIVRIKINEAFRPDTGQKINDLESQDARQAYADCWNSFKRDLEEFWKPRLFPAWLRVDFRYTVDWPGFNRLGERYVLLGDGFTLRKAA